MTIKIITDNNERSKTEIILYTRPVQIHRGWLKLRRLPGNSLNLLPNHWMFCECGTCFMLLINIPEVTFLQSGKRSLQAAFLVSHFEGLLRGQQQILCFYLLCRVTSLGKDGCPIFPTTFLPLFLNCRS